MRKKMIIPNNKVKVFISSICGEPKYDRIREELKSLIERTNFADVYLFEAEGASTASAGSHYVFSLEDCDVCIFLIDNNDGITPGVQKEINTVKKHNIKALYYFCTEESDEETALQKSLKGASYAKSRNVKSFNQLGERGAQDLINDIVFIYHHYCKNRLTIVTDDETEKATEIFPLQSMKESECTISKLALEQIDKCSDYIIEFTTREKAFRIPGEIVQSSELDKWGLRFLKVIFGEKSILDFNVAMMLSTLRNQQVEEFHQVVNVRWKAIQEYFCGNLFSCIDYLKQALVLAKENCSPEWVIQDILIDLRNMQVEYGNEKNELSIPEAQDELDKLEKNVVYPVIDRINNSLKSDYVQGLYKKEIQSPHTVLLGTNLNIHGKLLASLYIVALYNGSLTHLLSLFDRIKEFAFYLSKKYGDWNYIYTLFKIAVYSGNHKEIEGIQRVNSKLLCGLSSEDAEQLMAFCSMHPIKYKRMMGKMRAFGAVGYYLSDEIYNKYEKEFVEMVNEWIEDDKSVFWIGEIIFQTITDVMLRMNQDIIAEICCKFFEKHYARWYIDLFKLLSRRVDINKMTKSVAERLIKHIIFVIENDKEREQINYSPAFLSIFRHQNKELTDNLNEAVEKYMPKLYNGAYLLETTSTPAETYPDFIRQYIDAQKADNTTQGVNGSFFESGTRKLSVIKNILNTTKIEFDHRLMDSVIETSVDTLMNQNTSVYIKNDAFALLCCVAINYRDDLLRNIATMQLIMDNKEKVLETCSFPISGNLDIASLHISYAFLLLAMGEETNSDLIEYLPFVKNNTATLIHVSHFIADFLEYKHPYGISHSEESIILINASDWLHSENTEIRWNSIRILFSLLRNPEQKEIINRIIIDVVEGENVYVKNLIMTQIPKCKGITMDTKDYIIGICEKDANYVTRMRCQEIKNDLSE